MLRMHPQDVRRLGTALPHADAFDGFLCGFQSVPDQRHVAARDGILDMTSSCHSTLMCRGVVEVYVCCRQARHLSEPAPALSSRQTCWRSALAYDIVSQCLDKDVTKRRWLSNLFGCARHFAMGPRLIGVEQ